MLPTAIRRGTIAFLVFGNCIRIKLQNNVPQKWWVARYVSGVELPSINSNNRERYFSFFEIYRETDHKRIYSSFSRKIFFQAQLLDNAKSTHLFEFIHKYQKHIELRQLVRVVAEIYFV